MRDLPTMSALLAFESSARRLSFKHAAEELNLTAGAVSRQIQALEAELGQPLFRRRHRRVELTPAGAAYFADVGGPLAALRAATGRVRARGQAPSVAVVAYPTFAVRWLLPRWGRFLDAHPDIDLSLSTTLNPHDFARGDADIAIQVADPRSLPADVAHWKLMEMDLFPVAAPAFAARLASLTDLAGPMLLHAAPRPEDWPRWLAAVGAAGIDPAAGRRFDSLNLALQAAVEGLGVAIGFDAVTGDDLRAGRLVRPFPQARRSGRPLLVTQPAAAAEAPAPRAVREWLLAEATAFSSARSAASIGSAR